MEEVLDKYFKDGKTLFYQSSDAHKNIEGDTYLKYEYKGKAELWFGGENGEVCLLVTNDPIAMENLIKALTR